jgi:Bacterial archaeo-eukaryotic release factor family 2
VDLSVLRPLYDHSGPWSSVYLDTSHDTEDAVATVPLRWRALKEQLQADGADQATVHALEGVLYADPGHDIAGDRGLALFGSGGAVHLAVPLPDPPPRDQGVVSTLPDPLGLVLNLHEHVPWLLVVADRAGADLLAVDAQGPRRAAEVTSDADYPLRKSRPGGWSEPRYQRAAQENWERNAARVARTVADVAEGVDAEVLVLAGDVRARQLVRDQLPERVDARIVETDAGGRAPGVDSEPLKKVTDEAVRARASEHRAEVLDAYRRDLGTGAAVAGLPEVTAALRRGGVRALLLDRDRHPQADLWVSADPRQVGSERDQILAGEPFRAPAPAALIRAAVGERADVVAVTADELELTDGVGAVLRYAQPEGAGS